MVFTLIIDVEYNMFVIVSLCVEYDHTCYVVYLYEKEIYTIGNNIIYTYD